MASSEVHLKYSRNPNFIQNNVRTGKVKNLQNVSGQNMNKKMLKMSKKSESCRQIISVTINRTNCSKLSF